MCVAIFLRRNSPNLCVFLHGGLKPDNLCALVKVADDWYGIIFPHSDNKKKSCIAEVVEVTPEDSAAAQDIKTQVKEELTRDFNAGFEFLETCQACQTCQLSNR